MKQQLYLSNPCNMQIACELTEMDSQEIEHIVGRFANHSRRAGQLRGRVVWDRNKVELRSSFGNKKLWPQD